VFVSVECAFAYDMVKVQTAAVGGCYRAEKISFLVLL